MIVFSFFVLFFEFIVKNKSDSYEQNYVEDDDNVVIIIINNKNNNRIKNKTTRNLNGIEFFFLNSDLMGRILSVDFNIMITTTAIRLSETYIFIFICLFVCSIRSIDQSIDPFSIDDWFIAFSICNDDECDVETNKQKKSQIIKKNNTISDIKLKYRSIYRVQKKR